ncbi:hypothetical protein HPB51_017809 [Rhipicephalus microplus]|uniref:Secreted protein n=1 Tax=Rhipicephalus microplus TaxID=6941 RepID=A0A9J6DVN9_RHIMP|nr:hypothetical protein HPB51_017809 [Rhipicephalus microplus]
MHAVFLLFVVIVNLADDDWLEGRHTATTVLGGRKRHGWETELLPASHLRLHCGARVNDTTTFVAAEGISSRFTSLPRRCLPDSPESRHVLLLDVSLDLRHVACVKAQKSQPQRPTLRPGVLLSRMRTE